MPRQTTSYIPIKHALLTRSPRTDRDLYIPYIRHLGPPSAIVDRTPASTQRSKWGTPNRQQCSLPRKEGYRAQYQGSRRGMLTAEGIANDRWPVAGSVASHVEYSAYRACTHTCAHVAQKRQDSLVARDESCATRESLSWVKRESAATVVVGHPWPGYRGVLFTSVWKYSRAARTHSHALTRASRE